MKIVRELTKVVEIILYKYKSSDRRVHREKTGGRESRKLLAQIAVNRHIRFYRNIARISSKNDVELLMPFQGKTSRVALSSSYGPGKYLRGTSRRSVAPPLDNSCGAPLLTFRLAQKNATEETVRLFQRETISCKNIFSAQCRIKLLQITDAYENIERDDFDNFIILQRKQILFVIRKLMSKYNIFLK